MVRDDARKNEIELLRQYYARHFSQISLFHNIEEEIVVGNYERIHKLAILLNEQKDILGRYLETSLEWLMYPQDDWSVKPLSEIAELCSRSKAHLADNLTVSHIPITAVKNGIIEEKAITTMGDSKANHKLAIPGDILFCRIKDSIKIGRYALVEAVHNGYALVSQDFIVLRVKPEVLPDWIINFLGQNRVINDMCNNCNGTAIQRINSDYFMSIKIPYPSIRLQKEILENVKVKRYSCQTKNAYLDMLIRSTDYLIKNYKTMITLLKKDGCLKNENFLQLKNMLQCDRNLLDF